MYQASEKLKQSTYYETNTHQLTSDWQKLTGFPIHRVLENKWEQLVAVSQRNKV